MVAPTSALPALHGKVVWVTGAGKGLGRAIAGAAARAGATVAASSRTASDLVSLAEDTRDACGTVEPYPLAVTDPDAVEEVVDQVVSRHGRLDGLVTSAGVSPVFDRSESLRLSDWHHVLDVNLTGTWLCAQAAGRRMLQQRSGSVVTVSSVHGRVGYERLAAYAASKGGVESLTTALAVEWAASGVRVNALVPGYFSTDLSSGLLESRHGERIRSSVPMGRVGAADELEGAALFLLGDTSGYVTGSRLVVDGGWQAW